MGTHSLLYTPASPPRNAPRPPPVPVWLPTPPQIFLFSGTTGAWSVVSAASNTVPPRWGHAVCTLDSRIYIFSGDSSAGPHAASGTGGGGSSVSLDQASGAPPLLLPAAAAGHKTPHQPSPMKQEAGEGSDLGAGGMPGGGDADMADAEQQVRRGQAAGCAPGAVWPCVPQGARTCRLQPAPTDRRMGHAVCLPVL
jgi:hypothetical protein